MHALLYLHFYLCSLVLWPWLGFFLHRHAAEKEKNQYNIASQRNLSTKFVLNTHYSQFGQENILLTAQGVTGKITPFLWLWVVLSSVWEQSPSTTFHLHRSGSK